MVIVIIALLLAIVLPSLTSMWRQRNVSTAETSVRGALLSARAAALRRGDRGLFFYLDNNVQKIAPIEADPFNGELNVSDGAGGAAVDTGNLAVDADDTENHVTIPVAALRYRISDGPIITLPPPLRACPRGVVDVDDDNNATTPPNPRLLWDVNELTNEDYRADASVSPVGQAQRQRNFFTVIFDREGQLIVGRDVLIHDIDIKPAGPPFDEVGDRSGLAVRKQRANYYPVGGMAERRFQNVPSPGASPGAQLDDLVIGTLSTANGIAISFPSADGLLVYDDDAFREQPTPAAKRAYLVGKGQPYCFSRAGDIVAGPVGQ